jgi:hypothetical protein
MNENQKVSITIRLIRSFEYRNLKCIVIKDIDSNMLVSDLKLLIKEGNFDIGKSRVYITVFFFLEVKNISHLPPPFKTFNYGNRFSIFNLNIF